MGSETPNENESQATLTIPAGRSAAIEPTPVSSTSSRPALAVRLSGSGELISLPGELRQLLRLRLRTIGVLALVGWVMMLGLFLSAADGLFNPNRMGRETAWVMAGTLAVVAVLQSILIVYRQLPMWWLRLQEVATFGLSAFTFAWIRFAGWQAILESELASGGAFALEYHVAFTNLGFMTILMVYGVFIPNTWKRTLAVEAVLASFMILVDTAIWFGYPTLTLNHLAGPAVLSFLTLFMSIGTAVFGSFKLSTLHAAAHEARRQALELGQYQLLKRLGVGGMGEVFLAEHRLLKRPCALKLIRPERGADPQTLARFEREVQSTAQLRHPNTVEIYDYGRTDDGTFYYVMEYLDGLTVESLVWRHGSLPPARVVYLALQICGALHEAHSLGLVHRDIKPGNVFVCRSGGLHDVVKLLDFGLVRTADRTAAGAKITQEDVILGTPEYMSPEQANTPEAVDARSDIYSLGALIYYMLTGRPPFANRTVLEMLIAHRQEPPRPLRELRREIPGELDAIILRCLAKSATDRFPNVDRLAEALAEISAGWTESDATHWWQAYPAR